MAIATARHPHAPRREEYEGVDVHRLPVTLARVPGAYHQSSHVFFPPVPDPEFAHAFASLVRSFRPDVIHTHGWILYSVLGAARRAGVPVVSGMHDCSHVCATSTLLHKGTTPCSGPALWKCVGCAFHQYGAKGIPLAAGLHQIGSRRNPDVAQWYAISSGLASRGSAPRPADRTPVEVVPTFIDDDVLAVASDARTADRPDFVPSRGPYFFFAGALSQYKGVNVLVDAHTQLRAEGIDIPLVLAGRPRAGWSVPKLPGVTVVHDADATSLMAAWRHAHVGVVPSIGEEGFGRVAVECLAAGTPCVVSTSGGLVDIVADGVEGLHVAPDDVSALAHALRRLVDDEDLRVRLGAAGPAKAAQFTLPQVLPRLDDLYRRVLSREPL